MVATRTALGGKLRSLGALAGQTLTGREGRITAITRVVSLLLGVAIIASAGVLDEAMPVVIVLLTFATLTTAFGRDGRSWMALLEAGLAPLIILAYPQVGLAFLPYLYAPMVASAFKGYRVVLGSAALMTVATVVSSLVWHRDAPPEEVQSLTLWVAQVIGVGLLLAWAHHKREPSMDATRADLLQAREILAELRTVSRRLPANLDVTTVSEMIIERANETLNLTSASLVLGSDADAGFVGTVTGDALSQGKRFQALLTHPTTGGAEVRRGGFSGDDGFRVRIPLQTNEALIGVLVGETDDYSPAKAEEAMHDLSGLAALLELALMFDEVRLDATGDERRRLAREIHDGIAQDLAWIGYSLDAIANDSRDAAAREEIRGLRERIQRLTSELRLSIFDLRHEIGATESLGLALTTYLRKINSSSTLAIHLSLTDASERLPVSQETELLRIAQEAVTNARRHSNARNLWVTCWVQAPCAALRIEDDGMGIVDRPSSGFGLEGMRERAERIGANMEVRPRPSGGTVIEVSLEPQRSETSPQAEVMEAV